MKKFKTFLLLLFIIPCFLFGGCSFLDSSVYVTDITKGETVGNTVTYIVSYSDGTTSSFKVEAGEDGKDGEDLTLETIQAYCDEKNITIEEYFNSISINLNPVKTASNIGLQSAVSIYAVAPSSLNQHKYTVSGGAGVIYKMDKTDENSYSYILTNYHVVESDTTIDNVASRIVAYQYGTSENVYLPVNESSPYSSVDFDSSAVECKYIGGSEKYDLAVLRVKTADLLKNNTTAKAVALAEDYDVGETAIAIGNPCLDGISVTEGIVSVESEIITCTGALYSQRVMRIDAPTNGGNSGGGVFNINGQLIGIVNAKLHTANGDVIDNIDYALPIDNVSKVADNLIYYFEQSNISTKVKTINLNANIVGLNPKQVYNEADDEIMLIDECTVESVTIGGLLSDFGINAGYVIKSVQIESNLFTINRYYEFEEALLTIRPNDSIIITYINNEKEEKDKTIEYSTLKNYFMYVG